MGIPYTEFRHLYPPRTKSKVPYMMGGQNSPVIKMWKRYEDSVAQYKMDGTNIQLVVYPDHSTIELYTRHKLINPQQLDPVSNFTLSNSLRARILDFTPAGAFTVYNVELLHHKTTMVKNTLYFFDTLVWNGEHLLNTEYKYRHRLIWEALDGVTMPLHERFIDGQIYVANNIPPTMWDEVWRDVQASAYCEGMVLKRTGATSRLELGLKEENNGGFLMRIRKPKKNFQY